MKKNKTILIVGGLAIAMIIIGTISLMFFSNKKSSPENIEEEYKDERIKEILKKEDVNKSKNILTSKELYAMLSERGITDFEIKAAYNIKGKAVEDLTAINATSTEKYPMYLLSYKVPTTGNIWTITVIGNLITAYPTENNDSSLCLTETEKFMSYSPEENKFYYITVNKEMFDLKVVSKLDATTIAEEDQKLGNN